MAPAVQFPRVLEVFMKPGKFIGAMMTLSLVLTTTLVACGKKGDDGDSNTITYGTLRSDGQQVTTSGNSMVQGMRLDANIRNITANSVYCVQAPCNQSQVRFDMTLNGASQAIMSGTTWSSWQTLGSFYYAHASACYDASCQTVALTVLVTPYGMGQNYEFRQFIIKKDIRNNKILNVKEYQGPYNSMRLNVDQLRYEL